MGAVAEGWEYETGVFYMAGTMIALANPLVDDTIQKGVSKLLVVILVSMELSIGGMVIGYVSGLPLMRRGIVCLEGTSAEELNDSSKNEVVGEPDASEPVS